MMDSKIIDEAFIFYNIDEQCKEKCYKCAKEINKNKSFFKAFNRVYKTLYYSDFSLIKELWNIKEISKLFTHNINSFVTNLMIISGYKFHKENMEKYKFDENQINIHKKRVKECFSNDLVNRKYDGVRISQMLWATYFIRVKIVEVGILQFEYDINNDNNSIIKIHINISEFHKLFNIKNGKNCIDDILNFVYGIDKCEDYYKLTEKTTLQRKIKEHLLKNKKFYLGLGVLKRAI